MKRLLFLLLTTAAMAQGVRYDIPPILTSSGTPVNAPVISLCPGTAVISGAACSPASAQSTTDITTSTLCPVGSPVTLTGLNTCQATGDTLGNAGFWLKPGAYIYCITGSGITGKCYNLTVPIGISSAGNATIPGNLAVTGTTTLTGAATGGAATFTSLNTEALTTTPTGASIGFGDMTGSCGSNLPSSLVNASALICKNFNNNLNVGNTALNGGIWITGTINADAAMDGLTGTPGVTGTLTSTIAGGLSGSLNGVEGFTDLASTGGQLWQANGIIGSLNLFNNGTDWNYLSAIHGLQNNTSGSQTGVITGNFAGTFESQTFGTVHSYSIWSRGGILLNNGEFVDFMASPTSATSLSMSGCPSACVASVTDTAHGYSTNDIVWVSPVSAGETGRQYEGYYQITVDNANTFHYTPVWNGNSPNANTITSANVYRLPATHSIGYGATNNLLFNTPSVMEFQLNGGDWAKFASPFLIIDPNNSGFALEIGASSGIQFLGGTGADISGTTGTTGNVVMAAGNPIITGILQNSGNKAVLTADWTCGTGGTVSSCAAATIVGSTTVPMTFTLPLATESFQLDCDFVVGQATAATSNQWNLLTATNGATNVTATYSMATAATATAYGAVTDQASTTSTFQIAPNWTLGGTGTKMPVHIHAAIEGASASGTVLSVQLLAPTAGDLVTIYRGSSCHIY